MVASPTLPAPVDAGDTLLPIRTRPLSRADLPAFLALVAALAGALQLDPPDAAARARLTRDALADPPRIRVLLAECAGRVVGYAAYFETYSTFLARPTLYLEDLFVAPEARHRAVGLALLRGVAAEAARRGWARLEWQAPARDAGAAALRWAGRRSARRLVGLSPDAGGRRRGERRGRPLSAASTRRVAGPGDGCPVRHGPRWRCAAARRSRACAVTRSAGRPGSAGADRWAGDGRPSPGASGRWRHSSPAG